MSLDTWKKEFYPVAVDDVKKKDALAHSLQKWIGLRAKNLLKHELVHDENRIYFLRADRTEFFRLDDITCALCRYYYDNSDVSLCGNCPIVKVLGRSCDREQGTCGSLFSKFIKKSNPEPMIRVLRKAQRLTVPKKARK